MMQFDLFDQGDKSQFGHRQTDIEMLIAEKSKPAAVTLMSTAPTLEDIKASIARYWFTEPDKIEVTSKGDVLQGKEHMTRYKVRQVKGRFQFVYMEGAAA